MAEDEVSNGIDFGADVEVGEGYPLKPGKEPQQCILVDVKFTPDYEMKKGDKKGQKQPILEYTFQSVIETQRKTTFRSWDPAGSDKPQEAWDRVKKRFFEIYKAFTGSEPPKELFAKVKGVAAGFELMANTLNTGGKDGKPVYKTEDGKSIKVWLIPTYFRNMVDLPLSKFIERVRTKGDAVVPPLIEVMPSHAIERVAKPDRKAPGDTNAGGADEFDGNEDDLPV